MDYVISIIDTSNIRMYLETVRSYRDHLESIVTGLQRRFGSKIKIPAELQKETNMQNALFSHLQKAKGKEIVTVAEEFALGCKTAFLWEKQAITRSIAELKLKGATVEMLANRSQELVAIDGILRYPAYQKMPDKLPLQTEDFLLPLEEEISFSSPRNPEPKKCFVVIASDGDGGETVHEERWKTIKCGVENSGYDPVRNADGTEPNWFLEMVHHLRTCEVAVVDLTALRPNCIWELGILNAWEVPIVIIQPRGLDIPSDIFAQRVSVFYEGQSQSDLVKLQEDLTKKINSVMSNLQRGKFLPGQRDVCVPAAVWG